MDDQKKIELGIMAGHVFNPHSPVSEKDLFSGRTEQIRNVFDVIFQKGQHAIIFGERGVGKTSLANVLSQFFPAQQGSLSSVRINCDGTDDFDSVWKKVFNQLNLIKPQAIPGFNSTSVSVPVTPEYIFKGKKITPDSVRKALLDVSNLLHIIIIDEFDRLGEGVRKLFADLIKNFSDYALPTTIILIGVGDSVDEIIRDHQSVSRALKQIQMPRMNPDEIKNIITTGLIRLQMTIAEDTLKQIALLSQGLPHYTHLIALYASREAIDNDSKEVSDEYLQKAINKAVEGCQQTIKSNYNKAVRSARKDNIFKEVLLGCALAKTNELGEFAAQDVCAPLHEITKKHYGIPAFARHLNEFVDAKHGKILLKSGESRRIRYRFTDPLMQPYIIMHGILNKRISPKYLAEYSQT